MENHELLSNIQNFSSPLSDKDCKQLCKSVIQYCSNALESEQYQKIIKEQNKHWTYLFDEECSETKEKAGNSDANECEKVREKQFLPAASVNCKELLKKIKEELHKRFGDYFEVYFKQDSNGMAVNKINEYIPPLQIFGDRFVDYSNKTYLPTNIEALINEWIGGNERIDTFALQIAKDYCSFTRSRFEQKRFMILDIFFSALELRMKNLPSAKKIDNDYSKSVYIIPDFLRYELSLMLPFYAYKETDEIKNPASERRRENKESDHTPSFTITKYENSSTYDKYIEKFLHPLAYINQKSKLDLSKLITKEISIRRSYNGPSMILKCCYPLYIFIYNNILKELTNQPESITSRIIGCKFSTFMPKKKSMNFSHIIEAMQSFDSHKKKVPDKVSTLTSLYALRQFQNYMYVSICKFNHAFVKHSKDEQVDFLPSFSIGFEWKKGNNKTEKKIKIDIRFDLALTTWLFVRYSELFRLALVSIFPKEFIKNREMNDAWKRKIIWPKNFFTAFNFRPNALRNYQNFHKEYNKFIDNSAKELYMNMRHIDCSDWLKIAQNMELNIPSPFSVEALCLHEILSSFFSDIKFAYNQSIGYSYDEKNFNSILAMKRFIDGN